MRSPKNNRLGGRRPAIDPVAGTERIEREREPARKELAVVTGSIRLPRFVSARTDKRSQVACRWPPGHRENSDRTRRGGKNRAWPNFPRRAGHAWYTIQDLRRAARRQKICSYRFCRRKTIQRDGRYPTVGRANRPAAAPPLRAKNSAVGRMPSRAR